MLTVKNAPLSGFLLAGCLAPWLPAPLFAGPIGDFSPLAVGNSWVYRKTDSAATKLWAVTTLRVASKSRSRDTLIYRLDVTDSLLRPGDTLWERAYDIREHAGRITGISLARSTIPGQYEPLVDMAFMAHTYDSNRVTLRTIDSLPRMVVEEGLIADGINFSYYLESQSIRGVGLYRLTYRRTDVSFGKSRNTFFLYSLQRFNTESFTVSVRPGAMKSLGQPARNLKYPGRDILGRNLQGRESGRHVYYPSSKRVAHGRK